MTLDLIILVEINMRRLSIYDIQEKENLTNDTPLQFHRCLPFLMTFWHSCGYITAIKQINSSVS